MIYRIIFEGKNIREKSFNGFDNVFISYLKR